MNKKRFLEYKSTARKIKMILKNSSINKNKFMSSFPKINK